MRLTETNTKFMEKRRGTINRRESIKMDKHDTALQPLSKLLQEYYEENKEENSAAASSSDKDSQKDSDSSSNRDSLRIDGILLPNEMMNQEHQVPIRP